MYGITQRARRRSLEERKRAYFFWHVVRLKTLSTAIEFLGNSARPLSAGVATEAARGSGSLTVVSYVAVARSDEVM